MTGGAGAVGVVRFAGVGDGIVNEYDGKLVTMGENKGVVVIGRDDKTTVEVVFFAEPGYVATGTGAVVADTRVPGPVTIGALDEMVVGLKP